MKRLRVLAAKRGRACLTLQYPRAADGTPCGLAEALLETELEDGTLVPIEPEDLADGNELLDELLLHQNKLRNQE